MILEHAALWTPDLERSRAFYETYFAASAGDRYTNHRTGFSSYFLRFAGGSRLELMQMPTIEPRVHPVDVQVMGLVHLAFTPGDEAAVDALTDRLRADGYTVVSEPRRTGDGYYESCVFDPDGNRIEIAALTRTA
jgi:lactoylglutathione lyase